MSFLYRERVYPLNIFRYSIAELFLLITYGAVISWCFNYNWMVGIYCVGILLGIESGRKTAYPIVLMVGAGLVMSSFFALAINGSQIDGQFLFLSSSNQQIRGLAQQYDILMIIMDVFAWLVAIGILVWFLRAWSTVSEKKEQSHRLELEAIVRENRESNSQ